MKKKTGKIYKCAAAIAVGAGAVQAVSGMISRRLMTVAVDRTLPKSMEKDGNKVSGSKKTAQYQKALTDKMEELQAESYEDVTITGYDGVELTGHWSSCEAPERIVIAMHGWRSSWMKDFGLVSDFLRDSHCLVLYTDQRSQGNSGGEYIGFGLTERFDCLEWAKMVAEQNESGLPVYLMGVSMGAATVLMTAGSTLPECVKGVIADCGFTSPRQICKHVLEHNLHIPYRLHERSIRKLYYEKVKMDVDGYSTLQAMEDCRVPILFIHGTDDRFVPIEMTYENYKACRSPKRLFVVPGAGHAMSYYVDAEGYERALCAFWSDYD